MASAIPIAASVAGSALGSMKGGDDTTQTAQSAPWLPAQPHLEGILGEAQSLYDSGQLAQVAPFGADQLSGFDMTRDAAGAAGPFLGQAMDTIGGIMGGGANPWQEAVMDRALGMAERTSNQQARAMGRQGSPAAMENAGRLGIEAIAPIAMAGHQAHIGNLMGAAGLAPNISQAQFMPGQMLQGIGGMQQQQQQSIFDQPFNALQRYQSFAQPIGGLGGMNSQTTPGVGALQGGIGGGLMGLQLGSQIGGFF